MELCLVKCIFWCPDKFVFPLCALGYPFCDFRIITNSFLSSQSSVWSLRPQIPLQAKKSPSPLCSCMSCEKEDVSHVFFIVPFMLVTERRTSGLLKAYWLSGQVSPTGCSGRPKRILALTDDRDFLWVGPNKSASWILGSCCGFDLGRVEILS